MKFSMAAMRSLTAVSARSDHVDSLTGLPTLRGDYYDTDAATWAMSDEGQARIISMGEQLLGLST
jgi:hypothetical protein